MEKFTAIYTDSWMSGSHMQTLVQVKRIQCKNQSLWLIHLKDLICMIKQFIYLKVGPNYKEKTMHPILNDEQILELCQIAIVQDGSRFEGYAGEFITYYVMKNSSTDISNEDLSIKVADLIAEGIGHSLVRKGLLDYTFGPHGGLELADDFDGDTEM